MLLNLALMLAASAVTALYLMISRRRRTPALDLDLDHLTDIQSGLAHVAGLTGSGLYEGCEATLYQNGELIKALMAEIAKAQRTVHLETFVWRRGVVERQLVELLCRKAEEGVVVRVLIDAVGGNRADKTQLNILRSRGVQLAHYHPIGPFNFRRFNNRNHRKLLLVDGLVAFVFGHGIADSWCGLAEDKTQWRDTGVQLRGAVVCSLQVIFVQDWIEARQKPPVGEGCFIHSAQQVGPTTAHLVSSSTRGGHSSVAYLYKLAIAKAREEIIIQNPYFAPACDVVELLGEMVARGVAVHLMVPGQYTDSTILRIASQHLYGRLLDLGVRLYEYEPTLLHQKIVLIDGVWSHIGSTNFDSRSLALNAEIGVGLLDRQIAQQLRQAFTEDLQRSREISRAQWSKRPWYKRLLSWSVYQLHGQL